MGHAQHSQQCQLVDLENSNTTSRPSAIAHTDGALEAASLTSTLTGADNGGTQQREQQQQQQQHQRSWAAACQRVVPSHVTRLFKAVRVWIHGPEPPQPYRIKAFLEPFQMAPVRLFRRFLPRGEFRGCIAIVIYILWLVGFITIIKHSSPKSIDGSTSSPVVLSCTSKLWPSAPSCGRDGQYCRPFENNTIVFSCPAECQRVQVLNSYAVGVEEVIYRSLVIGGGTDESRSDDRPIYRGDSFICGAAIHAGAISGERGGCGVLSLTGDASGYQAVERNGISSVGFNSSFPLSYTFIQNDRRLKDLKCEGDPQWSLFPLSVVFTMLISMFTTSPAAFFGPIFAIVFFQVALASDAPSFSDYYSGASTAIGRFLPAALIAILIYTNAVRHTLHKLTAQIEKTVLWLGACWVGAVSNYTLEKIPIQRLNAHDLQQQPGAMAALVIIIIVLLIIVVGQIWVLRREGRLPHYLRGYAITIVLLLLLLAIPGLDLRIHHYILALLLLPGTKVQTRPTLLYQGLLVGLFINGIARWGFDSILQTAAALQGDAKLGSLLPNISTPIIGSNNITFSWGDYRGGYKGISVLVNDVERFNAFEGDGQTGFTWTRHAPNFPEYFRFGYIAYASFSGISYGDFTKAGTWQTNGSWVQMQPGPS